MKIYRKYNKSKLTRNFSQKLQGQNRSTKSVTGYGSCQMKTGTGSWKVCSMDLS